MNRADCCMSPNLTICIPQDLLNTILEGARQLYPRESFLLLRGKKNKNMVHISDLILAPFAVHGNGFASFQPRMLPIDFSIVGTAHSHPSGDTRPSDVDLNQSFGRVLMIVGFPYDDIRCVAVYNASGEKLVLEVIQDEGEKTS